MSLGHPPDPRLDTMKSASILLVQMARDSRRAVMSEWDLLLLARKLFHDRQYLGTSIPPRNRELNARRARKIVSEATYDNSYGFENEVPPDRLRRDPEFSSMQYIVCGGDTTRVILEADPFSYVSHASALEMHGLAPAPAELHVSTPERSIWPILARKRMEEGLGLSFSEVREDDLPFRLSQPQPAQLVRGMIVYRHETRDPTTAYALASEAMRVTSIGETFRDTLAKPAWCGGMTRVASIWREHARNYANEIIEAVQQSADKIVRVRAGYLLEEVLGVQDPRIGTWLADAQRGSSRKLDPAAPYAGRFSARWMLSINLDDPSLPATTI